MYIMVLDILAQVVSILQYKIYVQTKLILTGLRSRVERRGAGAGALLASSSSACGSGRGGRGGFILPGTILNHRVL